MAAQIGGDNVPVVAQFFRHPIPTARMIAAAVDEEQRWRLGVSPIDIIEPKSLRDEAVGDWAG